jgi:C1A family cysteine protease
MECRVNHVYLLSTATMWVYPDFFVYNKGIYRKSQFIDESAKGFHSVRLIGWGEESFNGRAEKYWIATNSWGVWWGERKLDF